MDDAPLQTPSEPSRPHALIIILFAVMIVLLVGVRFSPWCVSSAGKSGWNTWARMYPNLVCALDLHGEEVSAEELEGRLPSLKNVTQLNLSEMHLKSVPKAVSTLKKLKTLNVSHNEITEISDHVVAMTSLANLDLSSNTITQIPSSLSGLSGLTSLNLSDNEISSVPSFLNSSSFSSLSLGQNPLPPDEQGSAEAQSSATGGSSSSLSTSSLVSSISSASAVSSAGISSSDSSDETTSSSAQQSSVSSVLSNTSSSEVSSLASSLSSSSSIDAPSSASSGNSSANSSEQGVSCTRNFSISTYSMCIPSNWTVHQIDPRHVDLFDGSILVAKAECPMQQSTYDAWDIALRSRTFQKEGKTYGADELTGTSHGSSSPGLLLVFMHLHDFNSWFGDNYSDVDASCQVTSVRPNEDANIFRLLYLSVQ